MPFSKMLEPVGQACEQIAGVLLGKDHQIKLAMTCLIARGHLLIEDLPGMGKTTLAHALAKVLGLSYQRVQFTSDLLPADILGVSVFNQAQGSFTFHPGPVFSQLLLADEINRSTPKTQSALLEAMEEGQVSIDGQSRALPEPFFVIATQNPLSQAGTFHLPESQLDRFLMRISLGYPSDAAERALFQGEDSRKLLAALKPALSLEQLNLLRANIDQVKASDAVLDYLQRLVNHTRTAPQYSYGLSPRGALALLKSAKTWALLHKRKYLVPEDLQTLFGAVVAHRVKGMGEQGDHQGEALVQLTLDEVDVLKG
ncbi:AAA family ATPase [Simiduia sp. 21SJ11W-1]|nr:AAA family ATPase [Simiduia sp. 21SJ11W-1]UTA49289.1 AAA family ATPase [Simiduia sp. 21SJ11W-1]